MPRATIASTTPRPGDSSHRRWKVGTLTYTTAGLLTLFAWLLCGDFAWAFRERAIPPIAQLFVKKYSPSDTLAALLVITLPAVILVVLGPIVNYKSDRHRSRWGRRIPFLLIPTPIITLALCGAAASPFLGGQLHLGLGLHSPGLEFCVLMVFGIFWTSFEIAAVTANTMFNALVNDVVPAAVLGRFLAMFRTVGMLSGLIFNYWLLGRAETHYAALFVGTALLYGAGLSLMCWRVKEGDYPPEPIREEQPRGLGVVPGYFRECFGKSYYRWFFLTVVLGTTAFIPIDLFAIFYAKSLALDLSVYGSLRALVYLLAFIFSYPIGALADRIHPLWLGVMGMVLYAGITLFGFVAIHDARSFGFAFVAHGILSSAWLAATASVRQRILPRLKFGQYASALDIFQCLAVMLIGPLVGALLDWTHHTYRYVFLVSSVLALVSAGAGMIVYRRFQALGGTRAYCAPE